MGHCFLLDTSFFMAPAWERTPQVYCKGETMGMVGELYYKQLFKLVQHGVYCCLDIRYTTIQMHSWTCLLYCTILHQSLANKSGNINKSEKGRALVSFAHEFFVITEEAHVKHSHPFLSAELLHFLFKWGCQRLPGTHCIVIQFTGNQDVTIHQDADLRSLRIWSIRKVNFSS